MILAVDAGNSNIVLGCMDGLTVQHTVRLETDRTMDAAGYTAAVRAALEGCGYPGSRFAGAILSSVVASVTEPLRQALSALIPDKVLVVGVSARTALPILIRDPEAVGADLIAAAEGAAAQYPLPLVIVDMGTATTFTVLDEQGAFRGGAIAPGVQLSAEALTRRTGLPAADLTAPAAALGQSTDDCLRSGIILGAAAMVDGMLERLSETMGTPLTAIATGGLAHCIVPHCRQTLHLDDDLLLRGMAVMYCRTQGNGMA